MRTAWLLPTAVVVLCIGALAFYQPVEKWIFLIVPPGAIPVVLLVGAIGMVVGVVREWRRDAVEVGGVADALTWVALIVAIVTTLTFGSIWVLEPTLGPLKGPDPCSNALVRQEGRVTSTIDAACFSAHPDYYFHDPVSGRWYISGSTLSQTIDPVAQQAAVALVLGVALLSALALALGTARRRIALSVVTLSSLVIVGMVLLFLYFTLADTGD